MCSEGFRFIVYSWGFGGWTCVRVVWVIGSSPGFLTAGEAFRRVFNGWRIEKVEIRVKYRANVTSEV